MSDIYVGIRKETEDGTFETTVAGTVWGSTAGTFETATPGTAALYFAGWGS